MKKIISLLLALMLICTFCVPAFAVEGKPVEYVPDHRNIRDIRISDGGNYIISSGTYVLDELIIEDGTLTIGRDVTVTVRGLFDNDGTLNVFGTLDLSAFRFLGDSTLYEVRCCGGIVVYHGINNIYTSVHHLFENGVCMACGYECPHNGYTDGRCKDCGVECPHTHIVTVCDCCGVEIERPSTGSVLSHGYPEIIYAIGGIAIGVVATLLISRKKKATVSSTATENEE